MNRKRGKRGSVFGIVMAGMIALLLCIGIGIVLVLSLQDKYRDQLSREFHMQHMAAGEALDSILEERAAVLKQTAMDAAEKGPAVLEEERPVSGFPHIFLSSHDALFLDGSLMEFGATGSIYDVLDKLDYGNDELYIGTAPPAVKLTLGYDTVYCIRQETAEGKVFVFAPAELENIFSGAAFGYQRRVGECLLVSRVGAIISYSESSVVVDHNSESFQLGLLEYSNGEEKSKRAVQDYNYDVAKAGSGYVTLVGRDGYRMQVSYCPLRSEHNLYFVSCFRSNLTDSRLQPMLFMSVSVCIGIILIMTIVLISIWAGAKQTNQTVERLAFEDGVTGGKNLNYFREFALQTLIGNRETPFVIYRFDISNFHYINESYGHIRADKVLKSCIDSFNAIFTEKELCVRMDADQFLAIMINDSLADKHFSEYTAAVNADARGNNIKYPIRFKCGIYQVKKHDHDVDVMIDHANAARKQVRVESKVLKATYSEKMIDDMRKVDRMESLMQKALADNEFRIFLQPRWNMGENRVTGAEALVRWQRPDGTVMDPDSFLPVFANNGFIEQLDYYMLESVCVRLREMMDDGIDVLPVSVNQSGLLLHSPDYVENVEKMLKQYNIPPSLRELEITEEVFSTEREDMIAITGRLKLLGVKLAMDNFGAGFSSLRILSDAPFDVIKIDRDFFGRCLENEKDRAVIEHVVQLVNDLGMGVVCMGVENAKQVDFLQSIGCRDVQGFYFGRPVSEPDFIGKYYKNAE